MEYHLFSRYDMKMPFAGDGVHYHQVTDYHREQEIF